MIVDENTPTGARELVERVASGNISVGALVDRSSWRAICRARGAYWGAIDEETWREVCRKRGIALRYGVGSDS